MKKIFNIIMLTLTLPVLLLTGCGAAPQSDGDILNVLASTSFLADIAQNVTGDRLTITSLLPTGADPHAYQAAPADISRIANSNVLILNGLEYEHFIEPLLENAGGERLVIEATAGLKPHATETESGAGDVHEAGDPHMWLDPNLVITYVENIRDGLIQIDPAGADAYKANAEAYIAQLIELDAFIKEQVQSVPAERRLLITNHGSLGYFAERYGFEIVDTILPSFSSESGASAQEIASTIDAVRAMGAPAIFLGEVENADLAMQIASETDVKVVNTLHLESLTDGPPASTYIDMMKHNVTQIVTALK